MSPIRFTAGATSSGLAAFAAELRRRHVVRVGLAYAAAVFVALQLAEIVLPAFLFGRDADAWLRLLVVASTLFFPVVTVLAWVYEITPGGVRSMADLDREAGVRSPGHLAPRVALLAVTVLATVGAGAVWYRADLAQTEAAEARRAAWMASFASPGAKTGTSTGVASVAVLPLEDLGPARGGAWFTPALQEALTTRLAGVPGLRVSSRTSAEQAVGEGRSVTRVGHDLGVDAVVEGAVLRLDDRVRITLRLVHAASDRPLWSTEVDGLLVDALDLQHEVAESVADAVVGLDSGPARTPERIAAVGAVPGPPGGTADTSP